MDLKSILAIVILTFVIFIGLALITSTVIDESGAKKDHGGLFNITELSRAGDSAYVIYDYSGEGNITMFSMSKKPQKDIYILEEEGLEVERFEEFVEKLRVLEKYGYSVDTVSSWKKLRGGIYIVPNGAMPYYVLKGMEAEGDAKTVVYIGSKSLYYNNGVKNNDWYSDLDDSFKERVVVYDGTLDQMMESGIDEFVGDLLKNSW